MGEYGSKSHMSVWALVGAFWLAGAVPVAAYADEPRAVAARPEFGKADAPPPEPATEAEKLKEFQRILSTRKFVVSRPPHARPEDLAWCEGVLEDLREGKNVEAIEPDVRADSYDDPALKPFREKCPETEFHRCEVNDGDAVSYATRHFQVFFVDLDGRPETPKQFLFHAEGYKLTFGIRPCSGGYEEWDLEQCRFRGGVGIHDNYRNGYVYDNHHVLVRVRGRIAVLDVFDLGSRPAQETRYMLIMSKFHFDLGKFGPVCSITDDAMEAGFQQSIERVRMSREGKEP